MANETLVRDRKAEMEDLAGVVGVLCYLNNGKVPNHFGRGYGVELDDETLLQKFATEVRQKLKKGSPLWRSQISPQKLLQTTDAAVRVTDEIRQVSVTSIRDAQRDFCETQQKSSIVPSTQMRVQHGTNDRLSLIALSSLLNASSKFEEKLRVYHECLHEGKKNPYITAVLSVRDEISKIKLPWWRCFFSSGSNYSAREIRFLKDYFDQVQKKTATEISDIDRYKWQVIYNNGKCRKILEQIEQDAKKEAEKHMPKSGPVYAEKLMIEAKENLTKFCAVRKAAKVEGIDARAITLTRVNSILAKIDNKMQFIVESEAPKIPEVAEQTSMFADTVVVDAMKTASIPAAIDVAIVTPVLSQDPNAASRKTVAEPTSTMSGPITAEPVVDAAPIAAEQSGQESDNKGVSPLMTLFKKLLSDMSKAYSLGESFLSQFPKVLHQLSDMTSNQADGQLFGEAEKINQYLDEYYRSVQKEIEARQGTLQEKIEKQQNTLLLEPHILSITQQKLESQKNMSEILVRMGLNLMRLHLHSLPEVDIGIAIYEDFRKLLPLINRSTLREDGLSVVKEFDRLSRPEVLKIGYESIRELINDLTNEEVDLSKYEGRLGNIKTVLLWLSNKYQQPQKVSQSEVPKKSDILDGYSAGGKSAVTQVGGILDGYFDEESTKPDILDGYFASDKRAVIQVSGILDGYFGEEPTKPDILDGYSTGGAHSFFRSPAHSPSKNLPNRVDTVSFVTPVAGS